MTEEMTDTPTYIPGQSPNETHLQTDFTNISTNSDHAPPAYDSLPDRPSSVNPSFSQNLEPSTPVWFREDIFCTIQGLFNFY